MRIGLMLSFLYFYLLGATFNGVILPALKQLTLAGLALLVLFWLFSHYALRWRWYLPPLGLSVSFWILAITLSFITNTEYARRIAIGIWFVAIYIGIWHLLSDVIANRLIKRDFLLHSMLLTGVIVLLFGWMQWLFAILENGEFVRPVSLLGNVNALGAFLVPLIPLSLEYAKNAHLRFIRYTFALYAILTIGLLAFTFSRGAWLGGVIAIGLWLILPNIGKVRLKQFWGNLSPPRRPVWFLASMTVMIALIVGGIIFIRSFEQSGRGVDRRLPIYRSAVEQFLEQPLTGQGLFTFGAGLLEDWSIPPNQPHAHAHSFPLNVAAELGILGLLALGVTVWQLLHLLRQRFLQLTAQEQRISLSVVAGLSGFTVHHLVDMPAMMPAIALIGIVLVLYLATSQQPTQLRQKPLQLLQPAIIVLFWGVLLISGWWSSEQYRQYILILSAATRSDNYSTAAQKLQSVIDADPSMAIYQMQQAFLYGMAAVNSPQYVDDAIVAYEKFLQLEPNHAVSWANLAALYKQAGRNIEALSAIERALELAPQSKLFQRNLMAYQAERDDIVFYEPSTLWVEDYPVGVSFSRFQYLREAIGRQYLPQVGNPNSSNE